jgi:hypothetical protein
MLATTVRSQSGPSECLLDRRHCQSHRSDRTKQYCGIEEQMFAGYRPPLGRGNGFVVGYPGRWPGLRNRRPLGRSPSANGAASLSPAQWAGFASPHNSCGLKGRDKCPARGSAVVGKVSGRVRRKICVGLICECASGYRAPLGRGNGLVAPYPGRWPGLRNRGPLGQSPAPTARHPLAQTNGLGGWVIVHTKFMRLEGPQ